MTCDDMSSGLNSFIPREVFPPNKRNIMMAHGGLPKYRLIGVIYHHGRNASGVSLVREDTTRITAVV
jgi:hypothetical protein